MAREFKLAVVISGDAKGGVTAVRATREELEKLGTTAKTNAGGMGALDAGLARIASRAALAASGLAALVGVGIVRSSMEQEQAIRQLEATLKSTAGAAGMTRAELLELADSLMQVTTFGDDAIVRSEALLLTFTKVGRDVFPRAQAAILDMATAMNVDLKAATLQVGKALNDPIKGVSALAEAGIQFSAQQKEMIKTLVQTGQVAQAQGIILAELETQFGGSAAAAAETLTGSLGQLGNQLGEMVEIGSSGTGALAKQIQGITGSLRELGGLDIGSDEIQVAFDAAQAAAAGLSIVLASKLVTAVAGTGTAFIASTAEAYAYQLALARMAGASASAAAAQTALGMAARAGSAALALVGGPVGVAVIAGAGLAYLMTRETDAERETRKLRERLDELTGSLGSLAQESARIQLQGVRDQIRQVNEQIEQLEQRRSDAIDRSGVDRPGGFSGDAAIFQNIAETGVLEKRTAELVNQRRELTQIEATLSGRLNETADGLGKNAGATGVVSTELERAVKNLREQIALTGAVTNLDKVRAGIAAGVYGTISATDQAELESLARTLDAKEKKIASDKKAAEAAKESEQQAVRAAQEAAAERERIRERNQQQIRETVAGLEGEYAALIAGGDAERERTRAILDAQGATKEQIADILQLTDAVSALRDLQSMGLSGATLSFDAAVDLGDTFKQLDRLEGYFVNIGDVGKEAIAGLMKSVKQFSAATKLSGSEAFGAYTEGAASALSGVRAFTKEGTKSYEALGIAVEALHTVTAVQAALNAFATAPFPANFAALAAALAAVASLGVSIGGSASSGAGGGSADYQAPTGLATGQGTVLGDSGAKSESIAKSLEQLESLTGDGLNVQMDMLLTLRSIDAGVRNTAAGLSRNAYLTGSVTGQQIAGPGSTSTLSQFTSSGMVGSGSFVNDVIGGEVGHWIEATDIGGIVLSSILAGMGDFRQIKDNGLVVDAGQTLAQVITEGLIASFYTTIRTGENSLGGRDVNVSIRDILSPLTDGLQSTFDQIVTGIGDAALDAAEALGITREQAMAALARVSFADLGVDKISFDNLSGAELEEAIGAVFSAIGDTIAETILPSVTEFQRNGEGAFETLIRVASQTQVVTDALDTMGIVLPQVATGVTQFYVELGQLADGTFGVIGAGMRQVMRDMTELEIAQLGQDLADLAGGFDQLRTNIESYFDLVLTDGEQLTRLQGQLSDVFGQFGLTLPASTEELENLVSGLDLTTEEGQRAFTAITALSPALAEMYDSMQDVADAANDVLYALGVADGFDDVRAVLEPLGVTFEQIQAAALGGRDGLAAFILGLNLTQQQLASLQPVINEILSLAPEGAPSGPSAEDIARQQQRAAEEAARRQQRAVELEQRRAEQVRNEQLGLEHQLLQLQGDTVELRRRERDALDESNRALYDMVKALEDAQRIAAERAGLEQQLLQFQGDTAALRQLELEKLDPSNRALQEMIWNLQDLAAQTEAANQVLEAFGLGPDKMAQLMDAIGGFGVEGVESVIAGIRSGGLEALQDFLGTLTEAQLAALTPFISVLEGLIAPIEMATVASRDYATATTEVTAAVSAAADERKRLEQEFLQTIDATAELRRRERDELAAANRGIYDQIKGLQDQKAATDEAVKTYDNIINSLRGFRESLRETFDASLGKSLDTYRREFEQLSLRARLGDIEALRRLPELGEKLRDASLAMSGSREDYLRDLAKLQTAAAQAEDVAGRQKSLAQMQFEELADQTRILLGIKGSIDALRGVQSVPAFAGGGSHNGGLALVGENGPELVSMGPARILNADQTAGMLDFGAMAQKLEQLVAEVAQLRAEQKASQFQIAKNTLKTADYAKRDAELHEDWDANGMPPVRAA